MGGWISTDNLHSDKLVRETQNASIANLIAQERRGCSAATMEQVSRGTRREIAPVSNVQLHHDVEFGDTESVDRRRCRDCASDVACISQDDATKLVYRAAAGL